MSGLILKNTTDQLQDLTVSEPSGKGRHNIQVVGRGRLELDLQQVTPDVKRKVADGTFKCFSEETGAKFTFVEAPPEKEETEKSPEGDKVPDADKPEDPPAVITPAEDQPKVEEDGLVHLGSGYYGLPDESKVRGHEKAKTALAAFVESQSK